MATSTATRAAATFPVQPVRRPVLCAAWGTSKARPIPSRLDVYEMCRIPKGAVVVGGWTWPTTSTPTPPKRSISTSAGSPTAPMAADPDGFGNLGVMGTDTVAGIKPEAGYNFPFGGKADHRRTEGLSARNRRHRHVRGDGGDFAAGTLSVVVNYVVP